MIAAIVSAPNLSAFAQEEPYDGEGGYRAYPPRTYCELRNESRDNHQAKPGASDALDCISPSGRSRQRPRERAIHKSVSTKRQLSKRGPR